MRSPSKLLLALASCSSVFAWPLEKRSVPAGVPQYVVDYAPVVYLFSRELYGPGDIGSQLQHTVPRINTSTADIPNVPSPLTLDNLDALNALGGGDVYLTATDDITTEPAWLDGVKVEADGSTGSARSSVTIVVDKGNGVVDAFYVYFYSFNWGGVLIADGFITGDHVGDWEHNMVRFQDGVPQAVWYSQHSDGQAFEYSTVFQHGVRPISFSANGTHANYPTFGTHDRAVPGSTVVLLKDYTDIGPMWDPALNAYYVSYDNGTSTFSAYDDTTPTAWLKFVGKWGDQQYAEDDPRQQDLLHLGLAYKYVGGPTGPADKGLGRTNVCPDNDATCTIGTVLPHNWVDGSG